MDRKIKILHVQLTKNFGGIESLLTKVYENIDRSKYQFDFVATSKETYQNKLNKLGGNVFLLPTVKKTILYIKKFNEILNNNYDIVHFHKNSAANIIPILLAKYHPTHPKIIVHSHNTMPSVNSTGLLLLHKLNRPFLNKIADERVSCANVAARWMFGTTSNIRIINNGIDIDQFTYSSKARDSVRQNLNISSSTFVLGNVGRFSEQKNQLFLIDIFRALEEKCYNSKLILVGDGYLLKKVKKKVMSLGLESKVIFTGKQKNIPDYLSAMDVFIMPSLYEGLPIAAVEAQAEGLNVFLSDTISKEVILTDNTKLFSLDRTPDEIADMILKTNGFNNRKSGLLKIKNSYSLDNTVKEFDDLYQEILG